MKTASFFDGRIRFAPDDAIVLLNNAVADRKTKTGTGMASRSS